MNGDVFEQSIRFPVMVGFDVDVESLLKPLAVRMRSDGTNADSIDNDAAADDEDEGSGGGGTGSRKDFWSIEDKSLIGELATDESAEWDDDNGLFDSKRSDDDIGFDE